MLVLAATATRAWLVATDFRLFTTHRGPSGNACYHMPVGLEVTVHGGHVRQSSFAEVLHDFRQYWRRPHLWIAIMTQHHDRDDRSAVVLAVNQFIPLLDRICTPAHEGVRPVVAGATPSSRSSNTGRHTFGSCSVLSSSVLIVFQ